jgi:hypothetical protein
MSFTRVFYDPDDFSDKQSASSNYINYRIFPEFAEVKSKCIPVFGPTSNSSSYDSMNKLPDLESIKNVESKLTRRSVPLTRDDKGSQDIPSMNPIPYCNMASLTGEDTRFTHPIDDYRSISATEYYMQPYMPVNPQDTITQMVLSGNSSRIAAKDSFVMKSHVSWDDSNFYPKGPEKIKDLNSTVGFCNPNTVNQLKNLVC